MFYQFMEIAYSLVNGPPVAAVDAGMDPASILCLTEEIMTQHGNMNLSLRPVSSAPAADSGSAEAAGDAASPVRATGAGDGCPDDCTGAAAETIHPAGDTGEEVIVLDDVFDCESTSIDNLHQKKQSTRGYNPSSKKSNSRRSSLGVFGAFSEIKMEVWS
jgi:hypothetical protein